MGRGCPAARSRSRMRCEKPGNGYQRIRGDLPRSLRPDPLAARIRAGPGLTVRVALGLSDARPTIRGDGMGGIDTRATTRLRDARPPARGRSGGAANFFSAAHPPCREAAARLTDLYNAPRGAARDKTACPRQGTRLASRDTASNQHREGGYGLRGAKLRFQGPIADLLRTAPCRISSSSRFAAPVGMPGKG
jgi:hypothetical protein